MPINASELTAQQQITAIYVAYYDRAPDPAGLQFWVNQLEGGRSLEQIATDFSGAAETLEKYPFFATPDVASADTFITSIYVNLFGRSPDNAGLDFWSGQLESGATPVGEIILAILEGAQDEASGGFPDSETILNKIEVGLDWATTAADNGVGTLGNQIAFDDDGTLVIVDQDAFDSATSILNGVTGDAASVDAAKAATVDFFAGGTTPGQTFTLTEDADIMPGLEGDEGTTDTSGDDLIIAGTSVSGGAAVNNLGSGDVLNGGDGFDTLQVTDSAGVVMAPTLSNVERINAQAVVPGTPLVMNLVNAAGVEQIWNYRSTDGAGIFDVQVNDVQEEAVLGFFDTEADTDADFAADVDFGGDVTVALDTAGTAPGAVPGAEIANLNLTGGNADEIVTLNIAAGGNDNFFGVSIPGAALQTLNLDGPGSLWLRDAAAEFDTVTQVNAETLEGPLDLDLSTNNEDIDFNGGSGATTLITGNGNSTIDTGDSADSVTVGNGNNTINTNGGNDAVVVGNGNNTIDTGDGNDTADITAGGDQTVALGAGDDVLNAGAALTADDAVEAGDGTDTLQVTTASAATFTANGDVDAVVNGFEILDLMDGPVADGDDLTVDLDNIDDIQYVMTDGTAAGTAVAEQQRYDFDGTGQYGGQVTIEGVVIDVPANLGGDQVADFILTNFGADIKAAYEANNPGSVIDTITRLSGAITIDQLQFDFTLESGDVPPVDIVSSTGPVSAGASFGTPATTTNGVDPVNEVQTIEITTAPATNGTVFFDIASAAGTDFNVEVFQGETTAETAQRVYDALTANPLLGTATLTGSTITIEFDAVALAPASDVFNGIFNDTDATGMTVTWIEDTAGVTPVAEEQTVEITGGTDADGGFIRVGNSVLELDPNLTIDEVGFAILGEQATILAENPNLASINYDTATNTLTFEGTLAAGNIGSINVSNAPGNFPNVGPRPEPNTGTVIPGVDGSTGGVLNLDYTAPGGTLELGGANLGFTNVNVAGATGDADEFNIVLATGDNHLGDVTMGGIEVVNVTTEADGIQSILGLEAADIVTLNVTGTSGVSFFGSTPPANLETVNADALDIAVNEAGVNVATGNADGTTFNGSAGQDTFIGFVGDDVMSGGTGNDNLTGNGGNDVIDGGEGDDFIFGGAAGDDLTGGAGADTFIYGAVTDSQGTQVDTIADFVSGEDIIDLSAISVGVGSYSGEANGYGAVLTSLAATGDTQAVLDSSTNTLYVDVDGSGTLDSNDMAIDLTGVTALDGTTDFTF